MSEQRFTDHQIVEALERAIKSCEEELEILESDNPPLKPESFGGMDEVWFDMQEERHEYLEGFLSHLKFIRDYADRKMQV